MLMHICNICVYRSTNVFISKCVCVDMLGNKRVTETKHTCVCMCVCIDTGVCRGMYMHNV